MRSRESIQTKSHLKKCEDLSLNLKALRSHRVNNECRCALGPLRAVPSFTHTSFLRLQANHLSAPVKVTHEIQDETELFHNKRLRGKRAKGRGGLQVTRVHFVPFLNFDMNIILSDTFNNNVYNSPHAPYLRRQHGSFTYVWASFSYFPVALHVNTHIYKTIGSIKQCSNYQRILFNQKYLTLRYNVLVVDNLGFK